MINMKYSLSSPILSNGDIIGYKLIDQSGEVKRARLENIKQLVDKGMITNAEVVTDDNGNIHVVLTDSLADDPEKSERYTVEYRIIQGDKVKSYRCRDNEGNVRNFTLDKIWELAADGCVNNIEAKVINSKRALVGQGIKITDIKTINS